MMETKVGRIMDKPPEPQRGNQPQWPDWYASGEFVMVRDVNNVKWRFTLPHLSNVMENDLHAGGVFDVQLSPAGHFVVSHEVGLALIAHWERRLDRNGKMVG